MCSGYRWAAVSIEGMASSSKWSCISSSAMFNPQSASWQGEFVSQLAEVLYLIKKINLEFVWVIRNGNSELLRLNMTSHKDMKCRASHVIMPPRNSDVIMATCCREVLWVLTSKCRVYARTGISGISPQVCILALQIYDQF